MQEEATKGTGVYAAGFADCAALEKREHDPKTRMGKFGEYMIPLMAGKETIFPPEVTAAMYAKAAVDDADVATVERAADEKLQAFAAAPAPEVNFRTGPLTYDENGVYLGTIMPVPTGEGGNLCVVMGVTVANQVPIALNLYSDCADTSSIHSLLAEQKVNVKALIVANGK